MIFTTAIYTTYSYYCENPGSLYDLFGKQNETVDLLSVSFLVSFVRYGILENIGDSIRNTVYYH